MTCPFSPIIWKKSSHSLFSFKNGNIFAGLISHLPINTLLFSSMKLKTDI